MSEKLAGFFIILILALGVGGAIYDSKHRDHQWQDYAKLHHCHRIGRSTDSIGLGNGDVYVPSQVIYSCDNNEIREYTR